MFETERLTDDRPASAPKEDARWKLGGCGRPIEFSTEDERVCCEVYGGFWKAPTELVRLKADDGCGMAE